MSSGVGQTTDSRRFLQHRVAVFGLTVAAILFVSLVSRLLLAAGFGYLDATLSHVSFWAHAAAVLPVATVGLVCRGRPRLTRTVQILESVGLVLTSACLIVMGSDIPAVAGMATTTAYALSFGLIARAVFVPSTARHTAWLGLIIGVPLVLAVYFRFLSVDLDLWNRLGFYRMIETENSLARSQSIQIAVAWGLTTFLASWATRVIYGLRKDVIDARKLGQYFLEEKLGEGGMGAVYRAQHGLLKRPTAIKLLSPDRNTPEDIERFRREVQMTAKLRHPNTVTIYDYGRTEEGTFYYAMELLDGLTLTEIVEAEGPLPQPRVIHIMRQSAMALHEAHVLGLVHRDVKPSNIMMTRQGGVEDVTKVLDFGLVKNVDFDDDTTKTWSETIIGTPMFMSPEQILDPPSIDARSDLYALGAVGYYLLTGRFVFEGNNPIEICAQHMSAAPEPLSEVCGHGIDPDLERLIMQCLKKKRDDRPPSGAAVSEALGALSVERWAQEQAAVWWASVGDSLASRRGGNLDVGTLATIHAKVRHTGSS
ncbi:MAG: serine/threonine-protein kinase [Polyangiales bacterium]